MEGCEDDVEDGEELSGEAFVCPVAVELAEGGVCFGMVGSFGFVVPIDVGGG